MEDPDEVQVIRELCCLKGLALALSELESVGAVIMHIYGHLNKGHVREGLLDIKEVRAGMLRLVDAYEAFWGCVDPENEAETPEEVLQANKLELDVRLRSWRQRLLADAAAEREGA